MNEEILGYFDTIVNGIHEYDENIDILINTPIMPYAEEKNTAYKNVFWSLSVKSAKRSLLNWSRVSSVYSKSRFLSRQWSRLRRSHFP